MKESSFHITRSTLWTDSQVVHDWLSTTKKQPAFVANRLKKILASTDAYQWKHVTTNENPADHGTRGVNPDEIPAKWLTAPAFLTTRQLSAPENSPKYVLATHEIVTQFVGANNRPDTVLNLEQVAPDFSNSLQFCLSD